jgi:sterol desaturase/sphingolipid hydroxylase (fatty acid hydroxylase superfamily)
MRKPYPSIRIFKSDFVEALTHVHPLTPLIFWTPVISWLVWRSFTVHQLSATLVAGLAFLGLVFWSLSEYVLHRFVFHFTANSPVQEKLQFLIHGLHHDDPLDPSRLVMPPIPGVIIASVLYGLFRLVLGPAWVEPFFAFFLVGYLCYDYVHFSVHHFKPRTRLGKMLKQHHMMHHFVSPSSRWGVSSPLWDYVFGTLEHAKKKEQTI